MNEMINRTTIAVCAGLSMMAAIALAGAGNARLKAAAARTTPGGPARVPVLVELFTSEGCSSCPPADRVLQKMQEHQPVANALVIPLSEHVDYWNYIGWTDPFSSAANSERQRGYAGSFGLDSVYTPQMVVNGRAEFVGSDRARAEAAIEQAADAPHAVIQAKADPLDGSHVRIRIRVDNLPSIRRDDTAEVLLAVAEDRLHSSVARGENAGRSLNHTAVLRRLRPVGTASPGQSFVANPSLTIDPAWKRNDLTAAVFVQERAGRRVLGTAAVPLSLSASR